MRPCPKRSKRYASYISGTFYPGGGRPSGRDKVPPKRSRVSRAFGLLLLVGILLTGGTVTSAAVTADERLPLSLREDHAVIAVTVDGHVHTLDAWTGDVRGVFLDSGGPLVSSSTTVDDPIDASSDGGGRPRNALREGFVVPGLDGVIYLLSPNGQLSVLMSSAPDLVLEPRMACLTVNADAGGVVKDEGCGLLIGEKTTQLFSLDTSTGEARRLGGEDSDLNRKASQEGVSGGERERGEGWFWGDEKKSQPQEEQCHKRQYHQQSQNQLLLQRDEYVVRAFDATTSEELWFVTVAHFSALDLEGRGGPTALTRAKVATADRAGYTRAIKGRFGLEENDEDRLVKALPSPTEEEEEEKADSVAGLGQDSLDSSASESKSSVEEKFFGQSTTLRDDDGSGSAGAGVLGGGGQARRRGRFGPSHADRFPYLLYENNAYVVAIDPLDGSVLWRKQMPALAVSLYGIRGREWVDILPPPMTMLQSTLRYEHEPGSSPAFVPQAPFSDDERLDGRLVKWSPSYTEPLLLLTGSDEGDGMVKEKHDDSVSRHLQTNEVLESDLELGECHLDDDHHGGGACGDSETAVKQQQQALETLDDPAHPSTPMLPAVSSRTGAGRLAGLLPQGPRHGPLHAQIGFLNGHFFVSSSLRRTPLHAATTEDSVGIVPTDRYPHPPSLPSRRTTVMDADARDLRGAGTRSSSGTTGNDGAPSPLPPPVAKIAPYAVPPLSESRGQKATQRHENGIKLGSVKTGDAAIDFLGDGVAGSGGALDTEIGLEGWRQALQERVEREIMEGRRGAVEVHPEKEGLYMSWNFVAAVVGLVSMTVIAVALTAYKHGAKAMLNVSALTRRNTAIVEVPTDAPRVTEPIQEGSGRLTPPLPPDAPSLHHTVSMFSANSGAHNWTTASGGDGLRGSASRPDSSQRAKPLPMVHLHRVHSLPALGQRTHSPPIHDRRRHLVGWPTLLCSDQINGGLAGAAAAGVEGSGAYSGFGARRSDRLVRAVTEGVVGKGSETQISVKSTQGHPGDDPSPRESIDARLPSDEGNPGTPAGRNYNGDGSSIGGTDSTGGDNSEGLLLGESLRGAVAGMVPAAGGSVSSTTCSSSEDSTSTSSCKESCPPREACDGSRASNAGLGIAAADPASASDGRRRRRRRPQSLQSEARQGRNPSNEEVYDSESGGQHRRRRSGRSSTASTSDGGSKSARRTSGSPRASQNDRGGSGSQWASGDGETKRRKERRRTSRSSRASSGEEELVLGTGRDEGGGDTAVSTGGDAEALLVTNRRLRTEFVEGQKLGRGGFGTVFKCRNRLDGHDYAIKKIRLSSDPRWQPQLAKVLREVKIMSLLDHPNIVRYYQAWLERFTEEDEELQRGQSAPSSAATSESWDLNTAGSRSSHNRITGTGTGTGTTSATNRTLTSAYQGDLSHACASDKVGACGPRSLCRGGGEGTSRFNREAGVVATPDRGQGSMAWRFPGCPRGTSKVLYEEQSVDEWSIDSRCSGDKRNGGLGGGIDRRWKLRGGGLGHGGGWRDEQAWDETEYSREDDDVEESEEDDDDDDASLPGFVFDRAGVDDDSARGEGGAGVELDGRGANSDGVSRGGPGRGKLESGKRPSGSVSAAATAPASSDAADDRSESGEDADAACAPSSGRGKAGKTARDSGVGENVDRGGRVGPAGCDLDPSGRRSREEEPRRKSEDNLGNSRTNVVDGKIRRDRTINPLLPNLPDCNGHRPAGRRGVEPDDAAASPGASKRLLPDHQREGPGHHASDGEGTTAAVGAEKLREAQLKRRPRGESWPQNSDVAAAAAAVASAAVTYNDNDDQRDLRSQNYSPAGRPRGRPGRARVVAAANPPPAAWHSRGEFRKRAAWQRGWGRGNGRPRRGRSKEVYDLWLYIQMQYCSHNSLQYFLEENPDRRSQTRVDMPQVMHIFLQIAKGLQYVHACGLIHRDLKPANCFLMGEGTVKIGDFGLSRHILPADVINGIVTAATSDAPVKTRKQGSFAWKSDRLVGDGSSLGGGGDDDTSITGGVGTYLYASPEQMSGKGYDEKTDVYSLGMLLFEMCHPPFGTKMERTVVLTNAHRLVFPEGGVWGPPKGQDAMKALCGSMLQEDAATRPSASDIVRQVEMMQGKHMLLQLEKKPPGSYGAGGGGGPDVAVVLRVETVEQDGLLQCLVDRVRALCKKGRTGHDAAAVGENGGARLEQYGLRGHTGSAVMEFLVAGAGLEEREAIVEALESLPEVKTVREFPANG